MAAVKEVIAAADSDKKWRWYMFEKVIKTMIDNQIYIYNVYSLNKVLYEL